MNDRYIQLWTKTKYFLEQGVAEKTFHEYFEPVDEMVKFENNTIFMKVPNNFVKNRIDKLFLNKINDYVRNLSDENLRFKFITEEEIYQTSIVMEANKVTQDIERVRTGNLNQTYTFNNFVTGKNNRLASTIAMQVADQPGMFANPLYIFGSVGIGKTHLMQSIGNYILDNDHTKNVLYVKTENFVEDYVNLVRSDKIALFNEKYKDIDVLLVDDIQFLSGKEKSQQEFFKLFENLHSENKQIVVTSDRPATDLKQMMERLKSRFSWGLVADINPPDLDHRIEILKKKLQTHLIDKEEITYDVLELIANSFVSSVRELEGALNRVIFYKTILNEELTVETALEALTPLLKNKNISKNMNQNTEVDNLLDVVCGYFNVTKTDLMSKSRKRIYVYPRQVAMYIMRELYDIPYKKIGLLFGGKDHSTVMNACDKISVGYKDEENIKNDVENIKTKVDKNK